MLVFRILTNPLFIIITKTYLCYFDPRKSHYYIVKLGYTLFFLLLLKNIDCGYSLEPPQRGGSNENTIYVFSRNLKNIRVFHLKIFQFLEVKFSIYLNRHVCIVRTGNLGE